MEIVLDRVRGLLGRGVILGLAAVLLLLAADVASAAVPARPKALSPSGVILSVRPTYTWTRAARATKYEVWVCIGNRVLLRKGNLRQRSWTQLTDLGDEVGYRWKVRGVNASGRGPWSAWRPFQTVMHHPTALVGRWWCQTTVDNVVMDARALNFNAMGACTVTWSSYQPTFLGRLTQFCTWSAPDPSIPSITLVNLLEQWEPAEGDTSGIAAYANMPRPDKVYPSYLLNPDGSLTITDDSGVARTYTRWDGGLEF